MRTPSAVPAGSQGDAAFLPAPELPRGGLVVHGMGEHWNVSTQTGTLSVSVPVATSTGRGASTAPLSLDHTGGVRSVCGYGWRLSVQSITRHSPKRLATYTDDDAFSLPGHDDLVPSLEPDGSGGGQVVERPENIEGTPYRVRRYRPRTDDTRTRIERCTPTAGGAPFWRTTDAGNVTRSFGRTPDSRITDPADPSGQRVAEWLLDEVRDSLGNVATYEYKREDTAGVTPQPGEQHRLAAGAPLQANRHLKRIRYANAVPDDASSARLLVVLDYGEHDLEPTEAHAWPARDDAYSVYTAGFEIRTYRLLRRLMVFHDFGADLGPGPTPRLVRTIELTHDGGLSQLTALRQVGYRWSGAAYDSTALPPVEFGYVDPVTADEITAVPLALRADGAHLRFIDLNGDGLPGVLATTPGGWWYQPPAGGGRYGPPQRVPQLPPTGAAGTAGLRDVDGTGRAGVAAETGGLSGTSVRQPDGSWDRYRPYLTRAVADLADPRSQRVDLNGDGLADVVRCGADAVRWTESLGRVGYGATRTIFTAADEQSGPRPAADDVAHEWFNVDMSGDGQPDLVRVRGGRVDYWPNLGWGRYGARVTMTGTLTFEGPLDGSRIRFADLDGTGTADLVHLGDQNITAWRNQHGTGWAGPEVLARVPRIDALGEVQFLDLLGAGTPCLVWTSSRPNAPVARYLDLAVQGPPHRLRSIVNNLGARTTIEYDTAARQQLAAARRGRPWRATTSSAGTVVSLVEAVDEVSGTRHATRYTYRDAWFDPVERESRGFSYAETLDAESLGGGAFDLPAVRTCEWFATGLPGQRQDGVFTGDLEAPLLAGPDRVGVTGGNEFQQSARALAGRAVRTETWVDDGGPAAPVVVTQTRLRVRQLQPCDGTRPAAFRVEPLESITAHYERTTDDPRITHDLTLDTDAHGTPSSTVSVAYRRRVPEIDEQNRVLMTWTVTDLSSTDDSTAFLVSQPTAVREYEITDLPVPPTGRYDPATLATLLPTLAERDFAAPATPGLAEMRLRSATRYEYWNDSLTAALPAPQLGRRALVRRVLRFALTPELIATTFGDLVNPALFSAEGGYEQIDGRWWTSDGVRGYSAADCYLPATHTTPFGNTATVTWDSHHLLVVGTAASTTAPLSLLTRQIDNDYLTLAPARVTDANGVWQRVEVDPLGRVVRSWRRAPDGTGDPDPLPGATFDYGDDAWRSGTGPCWSHAATRERHGDPAALWNEQRMFVDGFGRIAMTKTSCEPGEAWTDDGAGGVVVVDTTPNPRWIGTGRTVFDNKGHPVEQYEPYFATTADFDTADALVKHTVLQRRTYDAQGRLVRVDHPDGTVETVAIGPWQQVNADRNDTVLNSDWYLARQGGASGVAEQRAATLTAAHADTPLVQLCDGLGRIVRAREDNGADGGYETRFVLDLAGEMSEVHDARGVRVGAQLRDAAGRILRTQSADAGTQLVLPDAAGRAVRQVTAVGHVITSRYDLLGRPTELLVRHPISGTQRLAEYIVYGEAHPQAAARMLIGQVHRRYDDAGLSRVDRCDLAGNVVAGSRQLLATPADPDWSTLVGQPLPALDAAAAAQLDAETFTTAGEFDALGRALVQHLADGTQLRLGYRGDALTTVIGRFAGTAADIPLVTATEHDARRRRTAVHHGNGVVVRHEYDERSGRPVAITARAGATTIQDLGYTYDPVGNVVQVHDGAAQTVFFAGAVVAPGALFSYDPVYRLRTATGREHASLGPQPNQSEPALPPLPHPNDATALRTYTESYTYDSVGNILRMAHASPTLSWTRGYAYTPGTNRLAAHQRPGDPDAGPYSATFEHDAAGNTTRTPHLDSLSWDHRGRMAGTDLGGGGTVTYHHDGGGNRVRKIWQRNGGLREERIYLGDLEIFRRYRTGVLVLERRTIRVLDGKRTLALVETLVQDADDPAFDPAPRVRYQLADLLGSSAVECDDTGAVIAYEEYHPFGTTALWLTRGAAVVSTRRYRYLGKEKDAETGYYRLGARHYCPWLGRWLSPDPAGLIDGVNRYSYAGNNPVSRVDPTGLADEPPWKPLQMWLVESKSLRFPVKATESGKFTDKHYEHARKLVELFGGPPPRPDGRVGFDLGHPADMPLWKQKAGQVSHVGVQDWRANNEQSIREAVESAEAKGRGEFSRSGRKTTEWVPGAKKERWQPKLPEAHVTGIGPKPVTVGGAVAPQAGPAATTWKPPAKPPGPPGQQLKLPGVQTEYQLKLPFDQPAAPKAPPVATTPHGGPQQIELFKQPASAATTATNEAAKTVEAAKDTAAVTRTLDKAKPAVTGTTTVTRDATAVSEVTKDAAKVTELTKDTRMVTGVAKEANAVAEITKDATVLSKAAPVAQDANALARTAKAVAPAAKTVTPVVKEAGALAKTAGGLAKVAAPVVKVVAPVAKVVGAVAKPLAVGVAAVEVVTAHNNTDRLVASGDLVAGVAMYCGPVGEAFSAGYTVGGLADKGIEKASKAAFGVDLSPSNGLSKVMDAQDKLISAVIPDDPQKPAYKNENKLAWFLIDKLGF
ncbi:SpvB/TcaC N-terminal domain-containing protein [Micromonospora sp. B11E3]|uniref:SpvB/TcaC N-terminal domain-containing protein n=1 Tax=Micromonospora sp. B11E3 TaxID=3153562 RepID=UPI00325C99D5